MKLIFFLLAAGLLATLSSLAQDAPLPDEPGAPVIYYPVPVVYQAPVYYINSVNSEPTAPPYCPPASTVTYIGGGHNHTREFDPACNSGTQVIYFGGGQACRQGYQFSRSR
ncbi:MAG: hypothetical protein JWR19_3231 [Pedosphaera sp.]|nr:hypothetical protein [Pedosphaera sp.]